jgi:hypothetical protein
MSSSDSTLIASVLHFDLIDDVVPSIRKPPTIEPAAPRWIPSPVKSARSQRRSEVMLRFHSFFYSVVRRLLYWRLKRDTRPVIRDIEFKNPTRLNVWNTSVSFVSDHASRITFCASLSQYTGWKDQHPSTRNKWRSLTPRSRIAFSNARSK